MAESFGTLAFFREDFKAKLVAHPEDDLSSSQEIQLRATAQYYNHYLHFSASASSMCARHNRASSRLTLAIKARQSNRQHSDAAFTRALFSHFSLQLAFPAFFKLSIRKFVKVLNIYFLAFLQFFNNGKFKKMETQIKVLKSTNNNQGCCEDRAGFSSVLLELLDNKKFRKGTKSNENVTI